LEINTVVYNPAEISIKEMEKALKKSDTFIRTVGDH